MRSSVKKGRYAFAGVDDVAGDQWRPAEPEQGRKRWETVQQAWNTQAAEDRAQDVVKLWAERMGWSSTGVDKDGKPKLPPTGQRPKALLRRYLDMVPAAPLMTTKAF
jgi:hypothetical protein